MISEELDCACEKRSCDEIEINICSESSRSRDRKNPLVVISEPRESEVFGCKSRLSCNCRVRRVKKKSAGLCSFHKLANNDKVKISATNTFSRRRFLGNRNNATTDESSVTSVEAATPDNKIFTDFSHSSLQTPDVMSKRDIIERTTWTRDSDVRDSFMQIGYLERAKKGLRLVSDPNPSTKSYAASHSERKSYLRFRRFRSSYSSLVRIFFIIQMILLFSDATGNKVWWMPSSQNRLVESTDICKWARQVGGKQAKMCKKQSPIVKQIQLGIELGIKACQFQMRNYRWNCTQRSKTAFQKLMQQDVRETSFVQALTSAAITYQITLGCANRDIAECGCKNTHHLRTRLLQLEAIKHNVSVERKKLKVMVEKFDWGGCEDNINYGIEKSKEFLRLTKHNRRRVKSSIRETIRLHNEEAGRMAIKNHLRKDCRCHGLTGSCTMRVCWNNMPRFNEISLRLKERYKSALRVDGARGGTRIVSAYKRIRRRRKGKSRRNTGSPRRRASNSKRSQSNQARKMRQSNELVLRRKRGFVHRRPTVENLVFSTKSPSYCSPSINHGSLGTEGRTCDPTVQVGLGSCKYMCCRRGYQTIHLVERKTCRCRLMGCCNLECEECVENKTIHRCL